MADIVLSIGAKVLEYLVEPVLIRPLRPIFYFQIIVDEFRQECQKLNSEDVRVNDAIKEAKDNGRDVYEHVDKWVKDVRRVTDYAQNLENELSNKSCCFSTGWTCHYWFSKKVRDNADSIKKLCERARSINEVARPVDLRQQIGLTFSEDFVLSKSADSAFTAIMEALVNDDINMIGLYGAGGSGKTTVAKQVVKEAERRKIYERAFIVKVPQAQEDVMIRSIQVTIADFLNLKLEQGSEEGRASRLYHRLADGEKVLIILDDVWKVFDPAKIGIPSSGVCKVVFTTRDLQVCNSVQTQRDHIVMLGVLSEDEAWALLKNVAGVGDALRMHDATKEVVWACKGIPKAIVNVGRALRGKETSEWEETLQQLKDDQLKLIGDDLHKEAEKLSLRKRRVNNQVEIAKNNAQVIEKDVEKWLADVDSILKDVKQLEIELKHNVYCFSEWDGLISKKGAQLITIVQKLYEDGTFDRVAHTAPIHQDMGFSFSKDFFPSKSSSSAFYEIITALKNDDVNMIGLYGMGGIGKTTLAKWVLKEAKSLKIFDRAIMVTVSQTPEVMSIQDFLNLELKQESKDGRASVLNQRLKTENVLVILDDVWKLFDLANIGLFMEECRGCKILLTTRRLHVCTSMSCQRNIPLHLLSEDEAWDFFKKKTGLPDVSNLNDVAKQIVGECGGLPIALATVGSALRNKNRNDLVEALKKLRDARLVDIPEVGDDEKNAYKCLRLSYDYLKRSTSAEAQLLLLLCSLFPEDHEINTEDLTRCAFGMNLFERAESIQDARGEVGVIVQCLIESCLLLGTDEKGIIKIHDVVRDVGLWIGGSESPERSVFVIRDGRDMKFLGDKESFRNCRAISLMPKSMLELSQYELVCPKLEVMLIFGGRDILLCPKTCLDAFFKHMKALRVLDVRGRSILDKCDFPIPQSLQYLADLGTVNLTWCLCSNSSFLGELKNLKILTVRYCDIDCAIEAIFMEMKKLKLLDLVNGGDIWGPRKLPSNVINKLLNIEELYTHPGYSFGEWARRGGRERVQSCNLYELNSLPNLVRLSAYIVDERSLPVDFCFPTVEYYSINVGIQYTSLPNEYDRVLLLNKIEDGSQLNVFHKLFPTVEYLEIRDLRLGKDFKNISPSWFNALLASDGFLQNLQELVVEESKELGLLFEFEGHHSNYKPQLQALQKLELRDLPELKHIWKGSDRFVSLCNVTHVTTYDCPKLKSIFSSAVSIAPNLQVLKIQYCDDLEEVFTSGADPDDDFSCCFQNLRELEVSHCCNLKAIFSMCMATMDQPRVHLPKLQLISLKENDELEHVFGQYETVAEAGKWPSLEVVQVVGCPKLSSHFVDNIQNQLQAPSTEKQLKTIILGEMQGVEKIMELQNPYEDENDHELSSFRLEELELDNLPDLKCIWSHSRHNIRFSYLTEVRVYNCNKLKQLFTTTIAPSMRQLQRLNVKSCNELEEIIAIDDHVQEEEEEKKKKKKNADMIFITFPKLEWLYLDDLPSLVRFCPATYHLVFPSLTRRCVEVAADWFSSQQVTLKKKE